MVVFYIVGGLVPRQGSESMASLSLFAWESKKPPRKGGQTWTGLGRGKKIPSGFEGYFLCNSMSHNLVELARIELATS